MNAIISTETAHNEYFLLYSMHPVTSSMLALVFIGNRIGCVVFYNVPFDVWFTNTLLACDTLMALCTVVSLFIGSA